MLTRLLLDTGARFLIAARLRGRNTREINAVTLFRRERLGRGRRFHQPTRPGEGPRHALTLGTPWPISFVALLVRRLSSHSYLRYDDRLYHS